ncbi:hypothetical protein CGC20_11870 [Leishmania donovani]|uniref:Methyltransferase domain family protein n=1 Tax=Leishmania donovani TaxID=5661 RepID=A0A504X784_LEIDO|nr:hypothetical protein CGC20_11870 [Leishmania donovani]
MVTSAKAEPPMKKPRLDPEKSAAAPCNSEAATTAAAAVDFDVIPTSNALLSARLQRELKSLWSASAPATAAPSDTGGPSMDHGTPPKPADVASVVPSFKVGTLEMYRRFPEAYDMLMAHHNCTAVRHTLLKDVLGRIARTAGAAVVPADAAADAAGQRTPPWVRVADFGCGTGRIESMVAQHPAVQAIYAYDSEVSMLRRCLVNTVRSAAQSGHYRSVSLLPVAASAEKRSEINAASSPSHALPSPPALLCGGDESEATKSAAAAALQLCIRPVPFRAIQAGFLTQTRHPRCSLVVCAWSLSYVMRMQWGEDHWHAAVDTVVQSLLNLLDNTRSDAAVVILETLGNGSAEPTRQSTYTQRLEECFGFTRTWVRTDYEFKSKADAERMVRFFFGEKMLAKLTSENVGSGAGEHGATDGAESGGGCRLMECTGIWTYWKARESPTEPFRESLEFRERRAAVKQRCISVDVRLSKFSSSSLLPTKVPSHQSRPGMKLLHSKSTAEPILAVTACPCANLFGLVTQSAVAVYRSTTLTTVFSFSLKPFQSVLKGSGDDGERRNGNSVCCCWSPSGRLFTLALPSGLLLVLDVEGGALVRFLTPGGTAPASGDGAGGSSSTPALASVPRVPTTLPPGRPVLAMGWCAVHSLSSRHVSAMHVDVQTRCLPVRTGVTAALLDEVAQGSPLSLLGAGDAAHLLSSTAVMSGGYPADARSGSRSVSLLMVLGCDGALRCLIGGLYEVRRLALSLPPGFPARPDSGPSGRVASWEDSAANGVRPAVAQQHRLYLTATGASSSGPAAHSLWEVDLHDNLSALAAPHWLALCYVRECTRITREMYEKVAHEWHAVLRGRLWAHLGLPAVAPLLSSAVLAQLTEPDPLALYKYAKQQLRRTAVTEDLEVMATAVQRATYEITHVCYRCCEVAMAYAAHLREPDTVTQHIGALRRLCESFLRHVTREAEGARDLALWVLQQSRHWGRGSRFAMGAADERALEEAEEDQQERSSAVSSPSTAAADMARPPSSRQPPSVLDEVPLSATRQPALLSYLSSIATQETHPDGDPVIHLCAQLAIRVQDCAPLPASIMASLPVRVVLSGAQDTGAASASTASQLLCCVVEGCGCALITEGAHVHVLRSTAATTNTIQALQIGTYKLVVRRDSDCGDDNAADSPAASGSVLEASLKVDVDVNLITSRLKAELAGKHGCAIPCVYSATWYGYLEEDRHIVVCQPNTVTAGRSAGSDAWCRSTAPATFFVATVDGGGRLLMVDEEEHDGDNADGDDAADSSAAAASSARAALCEVTGMEGVPLRVSMSRARSFCVIVGVAKYVVLSLYDDDY